MHLRHLIVVVILAIYFLKPIKSFERDNFEAANNNEPSYRIPIGKSAAALIARIPKKNPLLFIGLITDINSDILRQTFDHAISVINADLSVPLIGYHEEIDYGNTMQGFNRLCKLMQVNTETNTKVSLPK